MNIGLIGSGGREHALCQKIRESKLIKKIICFPGNAGTAKIAKNINSMHCALKKFKRALKMRSAYKNFRTRFKKMSMRFKEIRKNCKRALKKLMFLATARFF